MSQSQLVLFDDGLTSGFGSNNGIDTSTSVVHTGARSIAFGANKTFDFFKGPNGYGGNFDGRPYDALQFWVNGGSTGVKTFTVTGWQRTAAGYDSSKTALTLACTGYLKDASGAALTSVPANQWAVATIPLSALGIANLQDARGVRIQSGTTAVVDSNNLESNKFDQIEYLGGEAVARPTTAVVATGPAEWYKADAITGVSNGAALATWAADGLTSPTGPLSSFSLQRIDYSPVAQRGVRMRLLGCE